MSKLPMHNYADIKALKPCYDPVERGCITADWRGTALDALRMDGVSAEGRLWAVLHDGWIPDDILHEFALWCAEQALVLIREPDPHSSAALVVKRRWIKGEATDKELDDAYYAARAVAVSALHVAVFDIDRSAAWAAWAAAWATVRNTAWIAARCVANAAAESAACAARDTSWYAARYDDRDAAEFVRAAQVSCLIALLEAYERESTQ